MKIKELRLLGLYVNANQQQANQPGLQSKVVSALMRLPKKHETTTTTRTTTLAYRHTTKSLSCILAVSAPPLRIEIPKQLSNLLERFNAMKGLNFFYSCYGMQCSDLFSFQFYFY